MREQTVEVAAAQRADSAGVPGSRSLGYWIGWITFWCALALAGSAIPVLAWVGKEAVLESSGGRPFSRVTDPTAPGYEVLVEPSETLLLLQLDDDGELVAISMLALSSEQTGAALLIPVTTAVELPNGELLPARDLYSAQGTSALVEAVERLVGVGIAEYAESGTFIEGNVLEVDSAEWQRLVEPVSPIVLQNPDPVEVVDDGEVVARFPAGRLELSAEQVGSYLASQNPDESDLKRLERHRLFWQAWVEVVGRSGDPSAVPGEVESGLGRFVRALAAGESGFVVMPAETYRIPGTTEDVFVSEEEALDAIIDAMVPFPASPAPGVRTTLRVLDGTGTPNAAFLAARMLAAEDGEIRAIGNGPSFDYVGTQILYYDPANKARAEAVAEALGAGEIELRENPDEVVMVTVILGTDVAGSLEP